MSGYDWVRHSAERAAEARKEADRLACVAWNQRMLGFNGPAQPSPSLGDALNAMYPYLEGPLPRLRHPSYCGTEHRPPVRKQRPSTNWNAQVRGYPYKRSHLGVLRPTKISAVDPPSTWWPGER
jgi:hypothetical protein